MQLFIWANQDLKNIETNAISLKNGIIEVKNYIRSLKKLSFKLETLKYLASCFI